MKTDRSNNKNMAVDLEKVVVELWGQDLFVVGAQERIKGETLERMNIDNSFREFYTKR